MSCSTPPAAAVVGKMPSKVCGCVEASTNVMVARANCEVSFCEVTTTHTVAGLVDEDELVTGKVFVGTVAGAVKTPFSSIVPQLGLHVGELEVAAGFPVEPVTGCVTNHVEPTPLSFKSVTVNLLVAAGFSPTGTVAVAGVICARMPESRLMVAVPFLFFSAVDVAVNVITGAGCG